MKKLIIGFVAILGLAGYTTFGEYLNEQSTVDLVKEEVDIEENISQENSRPPGSLDIIPSEIFSDMSELATRSSLVVVGQVKTSSEPFEYGSVTFFESQIQIKDLYRDANNGLTKNDTITLLQNDIEEIDPLVKKGEKVLLFLKKYEGPVIDDAYRIVGLYQGHFKVDSTGNLITVGNKNSHKIKTDSKSNNLSSLDEVLENSPYVEEESTVMTDEEIDAFNEEQKRLLENSKQNGENEDNN